MHQDYFIVAIGMRMGVDLGGCAMGSPARMRDTREPSSGLDLRSFSKALIFPGDFLVASEFLDDG
jgi:hypothetical protein